jgi:threonyl-tRNA synthetase
VSSHVGSDLGLKREVESALDELARAEAAVEEEHSILIDAALLERSGWLTSFPHLAVAASGIDPETSEFAGERFVLAPASCHGVYHHHAGTTLTAPRASHVRGSVFRNEASFTPLRRQRQFTMDEIVCLASPDEVQSFLDRTRGRLTELFESWGLRFEWQVATDPFYREMDPAALIQKLIPVKLEAVLEGDDLAIASVNVHNQHFGEAFDITVSGETASSGCTAVGVERVMWALRHRGQETA